MKGPMPFSAEHMTGCGYLLGVSRYDVIGMYKRAREGNKPANSY